MKMVIVDQKTRKMNMKKTTDFIFKAMKDMWLVVIISRKAKKHTNSNSSNKKLSKMQTSNPNKYYEESKINYPKNKSLKKVLKKRKNFLTKFLNKSLDWNNKICLWMYSSMTIFYKHLYKFFLQIHQKANYMSQYF